MIRIAPLRSSFMLASMLGGLASVLIVYPKISKPFGAAFTLVFLIMFIAAVISFIYAPLQEYPMPRMAKKKD